MSLNQEKKRGETVQRVLTAAVLLPVVIALIVWSELSTFLLLATVAWICSRELSRMDRARFTDRNVNSVRTWIAVLYVVVSLGVLLNLRSRWGPGAVLYALTIAVMGDSAAYFAGRRWGRHKLWPPKLSKVSEGKTMEGVIIGVLASWAAVVPTMSLHIFSQIGWVRGALLSLAGGIVGPCGDLLESWHKRQMRAKDSGTILPGHGGFLDRIDGLMPIGVLVWTVLMVT